MTEQSRAKLICITHLLHHEVIYDMQTLTELIDELNHIIRALSKEEESDQWDEFSPHPPGPPLPKTCKCQWGNEDG